MCFLMFIIQIFTGRKHLNRKNCIHPLLFKDPFFVQKKKLAFGSSSLWISGLSGSCCRPAMTIHDPWWSMIHDPWLCHDHYLTKKQVHACDHSIRAGQTHQCPRTSRQCGSIKLGFLLPCVGRFTYLSSENPLLKAQEGAVDSIQLRFGKTIRPGTKPRDNLAGSSHQWKHSQLQRLFTPTEL